MAESIVHFVLILASIRSTCGREDNFASRDIGSEAIYTLPHRAYVRHPWLPKTSASACANLTKAVVTLGLQNRSSPMFRPLFQHITTEHRWQLRQTSLLGKSHLPCHPSEQYINKSSFHGGKVKGKLANKQIFGKRNRAKTKKNCVPAIPTHSFYHLFSLF